ncbi:hypothetical protein GCM10023353_23750 [Tomitella cavernea]|uniref:Secreted protein n=1 Tax=Tomitella cavernea TaxID=1387982 RepID=A0ABP9CSU4_9ACTN
MPSDVESSALVDVAFRGCGCGRAVGALTACFLWSGPPRRVSVRGDGGWSVLGTTKNPRQQKLLYEGGASKRERLR